METQFVDKSRVTIREISKNVARDFIEKHHYTKKASSTRYAIGIFYREDAEHMFFGGDNRGSVGAGNSLSSTYMNGYIGEVLIFTRAITPSEITSTENYIKTKWNI